MSHKLVGATHVPTCSFHSSTGLHIVSGEEVFRGRNIPQNKPTGTHSLRSTPTDLQVHWNPLSNNIKLVRTKEPLGANGLHLPQVPQVTRSNRAGAVPTASLDFLLILGSHACQGTA